jgi:uncharacterized protein (DUF433 family)
MEIVNHIEVRDGKAYIQGRNIKAEMVARLHIMEQMRVEDVAEQYNLSPAEVYSAIAFYYDNQATLDAEYEKSLELAREIGTSFDEFKHKIESRRNRHHLEDK